MGQGDPGQRDPHSPEPRAAQPHSPGSHSLDPESLDRGSFDRGSLGPGGPVPPRRDKRLYFALMGTCVVLIVVAWQVVRHFSILAPVIMSALALIIPPVAVIIAHPASALDRRP